MAEIYPIGNARVTSRSIRQNDENYRLAQLESKEDEQLCEIMRLKASAKWKRKSPKIRENGEYINNVESKKPSWEAACRRETYGYSRRELCLIMHKADAAFEVKAAGGWVIGRRANCTHASPEKKKILILWRSLLACAAVSMRWRERVYDGTLSNNRRTAEKEKLGINKAPEEKAK